MDITADIARIKANTSVAQSALDWINGAAARQQAAVDAAKALGASPEQVAQMQAEVDLQTSKASEISAAIANTSGTPAG